MGEIKTLIGPPVIPSGKSLMHFVILLLTGTPPFSYIQLTVNKGLIRSYSLSRVTDWMPIAFGTWGNRLWRQFLV